MNTNLQPKALWQTPNTQDRLIFRVINGQVIYATRGGNVMNDFTSGEVKSVNDFVSEATFHSIVSDGLFEKASAALSKWLEKQPE